MKTGTSLRAALGAFAVGMMLIAVASRRIDAQGVDTSGRRAVDADLRAHLKGAVKTRDNGPIKGADVWLVSLDRHVQTDSTGEFLFDSLPAGKLLFEIRHVGFVARREAITFNPGDLVVRLFTLEASAQSLDTVRTVAPEQKYLSPLLRGFEERRNARQGGQFISDSVLRANDNTTLANVLHRIPGATVTNGPRGSSVLVSTRKQCAGGAFSACTHPNCFVEIYIDGVLIYYPDTKKGAEAPPDLAKMGVTDLAGVEFYADAASMPIGMHSSTDQGCGSLWLWTREE